jgi:hypothetical protein
MTHLKQYPSLAYVAVPIVGCNFAHVGKLRLQPFIAAANRDPTEGLAIIRLGDRRPVNEIS